MPAKIEQGGIENLSVRCIEIAQPTVDRFPKIDEIRTVEKEMQMGWKSVHRANNFETGKRLLKGHSVHLVSGSLFS